jgi:N-acetylmuramoyl-L-alanine amidase
MSYCSPHFCRFLILFAISLIYSLSYGKMQETKGFMTVVIDAGHGGKDPGTVVGKAREKDIVLDIALKLGKSIREKLPDVRVIFTRKTDVFIPLFERSVIANKNNADLFISIHANFCEAPSVKGTETYVLGLHRTEDNLNVAKKENSVILFENDYTTRYEGFDPNLSESYIIFELIQNSHIDQSVAFAGILQDSFLNHAKRANRDVRQAGFLVLRETAMPAVLIETGYLSNKSESIFLMTSEGRDAISTSIFNSFKSYKEKFESRLEIASRPIKNQSSEKSDSTPSEQPTNKMTKDITERQSEEKSKNDHDTNFPEGKKNRNVPNQITFAIQISAYPKKLPLNSILFKGIENISEFRMDGYHKYYCLETNSFAKAKKNLSIIRIKIPDAFIIAFSDRTPISLKGAINAK